MDKNTMRNIVFILLFPLFSFAQECYDSTALEPAPGGLFKKTVYTICEDGSGHSRTEKAQTGAYWATEAQNEATIRANSWRTMLVETSKIPASFKETKRELTAIKTTVGISGMDTIQKTEIVYFLNAGFKLKEASGISDIVFSQTAGGQMRYKIGAATAKNAFVLPGLIQLIDYPSAGVDTIFAKLENGNYVAPGRSSVIRRPGSTQNTPKKK